MKLALYKYAIIIIIMNQTTDNITMHIHINQGCAYSCMQYMVIVV